MLEPETILSRASGWLSGFTFKFWLALCALLLAANGVSYCKGVRDGRALQAATYADAERKAGKVNDESAGIAAGERETDTNQIDRNQKDRSNAIKAAPDGDNKPSAASNAANCERLRQAGRDLSEFPACQ